MARITKLYVDTAHGQIHARSIDAEREATSPAVVCLHPAPSSGLYFTTVMPLLNAQRRVIAPDYPGYGGSDAADDVPTIGDYAAAMLEFVDVLEIGGPVDVLGFHTGCLVGAEMALQRPDGIHRLVLCDVPFFDAAQRADLRQRMAQPMAISGQLDSLAAPWNFNVAGRIETVPLPRAFELFAEHLRAGRNDYKAFDAAFSYDCEARFALLDADVTLLATQSGLHAPTERAVHSIRGAAVVEVPEVTTAVFEQGAEAIAKRILEALAL